MNTSLSADGMYCWDGQQWAPTLSADGRYRWNGNVWLPEAAGPEKRTDDTRVATTSSRPMQYLIAGWFAVQAAGLSTLPFWYINTMTQWADAMNRQNQQLNPGSPTPPPDLSNTNNEMTVAFYLVVLILLVIAVVAIVGALKQWIWAFYTILCLLGLEAIWCAFSVLGWLAMSVATKRLLGQSVGPPALMVWAEAGAAIVSTALFVWLLATLRTGPWAMKRVGAISPFA